MITRATSSTDAVQVAQASWMPMVVIALAQIILIFNVSTLQVSVDGIASSFGAPATTVGTAIVTYALVVAGFIMLGGRIAEMFGARRVFRATVLAFAAAMTLAALGPNETTMILAQIVAGAAAAALVPTLVVLVAQHYSGSQRERALGLLGGAFSLGIVLAFLIAGFLATAVHWRATFGLLVVLSAVTLRLSSRFVSIEGRPGVQVDRVG
ncbi:MAG TPA: MFS transporter, partial [Gemmatimonadaceae bacterium]